MIVDLYSQGDISAQRCGRILDKAGKAKVVSCQAASGATKSRDLQKKLLQTSTWPPIYQCNVPLKGRDGAEVLAPMAFLFPHEVLHGMVSLGSLQTISGKAGLDHLSLKHLEECEGQFGCSFVPLAMWSDAVPVSWDRGEAVQCLT